MKRILVSLVSNQTIPNVQFIKEKEADEYLFIVTDETEEHQNWIIDACMIDSHNITSIVVDPFSYKNVFNSVKNVTDPNATYIVNLTGGTKIMSLAVNDFFRTVNSEIFYLTGKNNYILIYPENSEIEYQLVAKLSLKEYLIGYGFSPTTPHLHQTKNDNSEQILRYFIDNFDKDVDGNALKFLHSQRNKNISDLSICPELPSFLERIGFRPSEKNKLNKTETKYLTGDWFEEYLFDKIKSVLNLSEDTIGTGWVLTKKNVQNEFDVLVLTNGILHVFECKTSIWMDFDEKKTLIAETIYKADSLRNELGHFSRTTIITISDLSNIKLKNHLTRARKNKITVFGKDHFNDFDSTIKNYFNAH